MSITINDLTVNFSHLDQTTLLEDWRWLIGDHKRPILIASIGNAFLQDDQDGAIHLLDVGSGEIRPIAHSIEKFKKLLSQKDFVTEELAVQAIGDLIQMDRRLGAGQVYGFLNPPVLGGKYEYENLAPTDLEVHFSILGRIHEQVRLLAAATKIRRADN